MAELFLLLNKLLLEYLNIDMEYLFRIHTKSLRDFALPADSDYRLHCSFPICVSGAICLPLWLSSTSSPSVASPSSWSSWWNYHHHNHISMYMCIPVFMYPYIKTLNMAPFMYFTKVLHTGFLHLSRFVHVEHSGYHGKYAASLKSYCLCIII